MRKEIIWNHQSCVKGYSLITLCTSFCSHNRDLQEKVVNVHSYKPYYVQHLPMEWSSSSREEKRANSGATLSTEKTMGLIRIFLTLWRHRCIDRPTIMINSKKKFRMRLIWLKCMDLETHKNVNTYETPINWLVELDLNTKFWTGIGAGESLWFLLAQMACLLEDLLA